MLQTYTNTQTTLATGASIPFNINETVTGCSVTHSEGSTTIHFNRCGRYLVLFNGSAVESGTAGLVIVQMYRNGIPVANAVTSGESATATNVTPLSFSTLVTIRPSCQAIDNRSSVTFVNTGVGATFSLANVVILPIRE